MLLTHHPLLYQPLATVREDRPLGGLLAALIRGGIAHAACHTNLDVAPEGVNDYLARLLGLEEVEVLQETSREEWYKLTVFVPVGYEDRVRQALADDRVGVIGRYSHCTFASRGQGTYLPLEGARPFRGQVAALSRAVESRLEVLAPGSRLDAAVARLKAVHPYEEPAYDIYPLANPGARLGFGRVGNWISAPPFTQVVSRVKEIFGVNRVKIWGRPPETVSRLALCSGSGGDLIAAAWQRGAQVYLTGEVRHHQATPGYPEGFAVLEVGHFASEVVFIPEWARQLRGNFQEAGLQVKVEVAPEEAPFGYL
ncbi:MAG: Nif3-like dinuclear metal center hexameric protein [Deltaproteobacteria bacterium]|nr:Nif3-like dinuclear metal center hexameric protein [Deltaproteobacteria bacterium]